MEIIIEGLPLGQSHTRDPLRRIGKLLKKMASDADWFPGKVYGSLGGRPPALSETNKAVIANSTMSMKARGIEPTYALIVAQCPNASVSMHRKVSSDLPLAEAYASLMYPRPHPSTAPARLSPPGNTK